MRFPSGDQAGTPPRRDQHRGLGRTRPRRGQGVSAGVSDRLGLGADHPDRADAVAHGKVREPGAVGGPRGMALEASGAHEPGPRHAIARSRGEIRDPQVAVAVIALAIGNVGDAASIRRHPPLALVVVRGVGEERPGLAAARGDGIEAPAAGGAVGEHDAAVTGPRRPALVARQRCQRLRPGAVRGDGDEVEASAGVGREGDRSAVGRPGRIALGGRLAAAEDAAAAAIGATIQMRSRYESARRRPSGAQTGSRTPRTAGVCAASPSARPTTMTTPSPAAASLDTTVFQRCARTASTMWLAEIPKRSTSSCGWPLRGSSRTASRCTTIPAEETPSATASPSPPGA
jgi:hypothetical protein